RLAPVVVSDASRPIDGVTIIEESYSLPARLSAVRKAFDVLRPTVDVASSHFALYGAAVGGQLRGLPFVVHFHGPWAEESRMEGAGAATVFAKRQVERYVYRRADRIIVLSSAFRDILASDYGVAEHKVTIIPGRVELNR